MSEEYTTDATHAHTRTHHAGQGSKKLCIAGMHRSGTSLLAMWLNRCGISFPEEQLLGPRPFNKKGHYEDKRLAELHDRAIRTSIPKSKGWIVTKELPLRFNEEHQSIARDIIRSYEECYSIWGWKDPRMSLFMHDWKQLLPDLKMVIVWRPASAVLKSLRTRSRGTKSPAARISAIHALQSWRTYNRKLIEYTHQYPADTLLLSLEQVLKKDIETIELIQSKWDVTLTKVPIGDLYSEELLTASTSKLANLFPGIAETTQQLQRYSARL